MLQEVGSVLVRAYGGGEETRLQAKKKKGADVTAVRGPVQNEQGAAGKDGLGAGAGGKRETERERKKDEKKKRIIGTPSGWG